MRDCSDAWPWSILAIWFGVLIATFGGWLTHVVRCIATEEYVFLLAGAIFAPIGVIHGWGIWLGIW